MNAEQFISKANDKKMSWIRKPGEIHKPTFACPICRNHYDTVDEMMKCFNRTVKTGPFRVGDLVIAGGKWLGEAHRIPNDDPWIAFIKPKNKNSASHFDHIDQYWPWLVITSIWQKDHREVCSLISLMGQGFNGWNPTVDDTHCSLWKENEFPKGFNDTNYWEKELQGIKVIPPSDELRQQAALLAAEEYITTELL